MSAGDDAARFSYSVRWSTEGAAYIGTVEELPSLSWIAENSSAAFEGIRALAADTIAGMGPPA